jgi:hypothetical protein
MISFLAVVGMGFAVDAWMLTWSAFEDETACRFSKCIWNAGAAFYLPGVCVALGSAKARRIQVGT